MENSTFFPKTEQVRTAIQQYRKERGNLNLRWVKYMTDEYRAGGAVLVVLKDGNDNDTRFAITLTMRESLQYVHKEECDKGDKENNSIVTLEDALILVKSEFCENKEIANSILRRLQAQEEFKKRKNKAPQSSLESEEIARAQKSTVYYIFAVLLGIILYEIYASVFRDGFSYLFFMIMSFYVFAAYYCYTFFEKNVKAQWYANSIESCLDIVERLHAKEKYFHEDMFYWWVDEKKKRIVPVSKIRPRPSLWQKISNPYRQTNNKRFKYRFCCLKKDGSFGYMVSSEDVYRDIEKAVLHLSLLK